MLRYCYLTVKMIHKLLPTNSTLDVLSKFKCDFKSYDIAD